MFLNEIIFFLLFASGSIQSEPLTLLSKIQKNYKCNQRVVDGCAFSICKLTGLKNYSREVGIIIPNDLSSSSVRKVRFHLHGHSFGKLPNGEDFDSSIFTIEKSFNLGVVACKSKTPLFIPFSKGKCTDFDTKIYDTKDFNNLMNELLAKTYLNDMKAQIEMSAHSGGGRTITRIIKDAKYNKDSNEPTSRIKSIYLFDAIYNEARKNSYISWLKKSKDVSFNSFAISPSSSNQYFLKFKGASPYRYSRDIIKALTNEQMALPYKKKGVFQVKASTDHNDLNFVYEKSYGDFHHWYLLKDFWENSFSD